MKDHIYIIAEAGVNHNGDIGIAKRLVDEAAAGRRGCGEIPDVPDTESGVQESPKSGISDGDDRAIGVPVRYVKKLELTAEMHEELISYCKKKKIQFLSTPLDIESVDLLER